MRSPAGFGGFAGHVICFNRYLFITRARNVKLRSFFRGRVQGYFMGWGGLLCHSLCREYCAVTKLRIRVRKKKLTGTISGSRTRHAHLHSPVKGSNRMKSTVWECRAFVSILKVMLCRANGVKVQSVLNGNLRFE